MGMLYARQNQLERALDYLEKAAELRPDSVDVLNNLGGSSGPPGAIRRGEREV
jgi:Tfp pilus assembly protein PilF